jgi:DNA-binding NarL/FixJ family response regulator
MDHSPAAAPISILIVDDQLDALPQIHIVMLSARETSDLVFKSLPAGARGYVLQGSAGVDLIRAVSTVLEGAGLLSPRVTRVFLDRLLSKSAGRDLLDLLSRREREVLLLTVGGSSSVETARRLCLSRKTVDTYRSRVMTKLGVKNLVGLMHFALANGLSGRQERPAPMTGELDTSRIWRRS